MTRDDISSLAHSCGIASIMWCWHPNNTLQLKSFIESVYGLHGCICEKNTKFYNSAEGEADTKDEAVKDIANWYDAIDNGDWLDKSKWKYEDGYYYYMELIPRNKVTDTIITWVNTFFEDEKGIRNYDILVYTETVQTIGTDDTDYGAQPDG